jgi:hypothetical protein
MQALMALVVALSYVVRRAPSRLRPGVQLQTRGSSWMTFWTMPKNRRQRCGYANTLKRFEDYATDLQPEAMPTQTTLPP